jgi:serine protease AprX
MKQFTLFLLMLFPFTLMAQEASHVSSVTSELKVQMDQNKDNELIRINIRLKSQYDLQNINEALANLDRTARRAVVINELKSFSENSQKGILNYLEKKSRQNQVKLIYSLWITNVITCLASNDAINELSLRNDIDRIDWDEERKMIIDNEISLSDEPEGGNGTKEITWNVTKVNVPAVWALGYTGAGIKVGVLDTGVNYNHVDLADHMWSDPGYPNHGYDFVNNDNNPMDDHGHGTHCAGTVAGDGTAGSQTGMAPNATIIALKVLDAGGSGTESGVWAAIQFIVDHGGDVISMSLGWQHSWGVDRTSWRNSFNNALAAGVIAAVAAGNEGNQQGSYPIPDNVRTPGDCPPPWLHPDQTLTGGVSAVVCIGATDINDNIASFSSRGPLTWSAISPFNDYAYNPGMGLIRPDVSAPGDNIKSLDYSSNTGYADGWSGTSMATPCVAGVMALMLQKNPNLTPAEIDIAIETTALQLGAAGKDNVYGSGRINALAAINALGLSAGFSANITTVCTGSTVTFTDASGGPPTTWSWSFPGGTPNAATGVGPHTITYSTPGTYNVSLTVGDGIDTDTETKTGFITVQNIVANFAASQTTILVGNSVTFTDQSICNPTSWSWTFTGGTPSSYSGQTPPAITYNTAGIYNVSLTVTKPGASDTETKSGYINVINCTPCTSTSNNASEEWISNVTFNTINNNSAGGSGYEDFTAISTNVIPNSNYTLSVTCGQIGTWTEYCFAFVDWNQDCDFNDAGESISVGSVSGPGTMSLGITIPAGAVNGTTRMRVSLKYAAAPTACETFSYGQVEDYTLNIQSLSGPPTANFSANNTAPYTGETVIFTDQSSNSPTSWTWTFNPATVTYVGGTNASSQNPQVQFNASGLYTVTLVASNSYGSDSEVKSNYINVIQTIPPYVDGFESFASGNYVALTSPYWTTWSNAPGGTEDAVIVTTPTHGGTKSVKIDGANDLVIPFGDKTSGKYIVSFYMYVPTGYYGYYNLLHSFNGSSSEWGAEIFFSSGGSGYGSAGGANSFTFSYSYNTWMFVKNVVDLDNNLAQIWLNGNMLHQWQWSLGALGDGTLNQLGGMDMYAWNVNGTPLYYFDDISYYEIAQVDLNVLLQGPYNGSAMVPGLTGLLPLAQPYNVAPWNYTGNESVVAIPNANVVDWILMELRDAASAAQATNGTVVGRQAAFILNNGKVVGLDGASVLRFETPIFNNLFAVVYHRNHISVMSAVGLTKTLGIYTYNFSTGSGQAYGGTSAHKQIAPGVWGMFGGDGTKDGTIGLTDESPTWEVTSGTKGYLGTDYNLDSQSNNKDKDNIWAPNMGTGTQVPN